MNPFLEVVKALDKSGCRYVIVGGFAVVMYGNNRFTPDINIVFELTPQNLSKGVEALLAVGLTGRKDVDPLHFANEDKRNEMREQLDERFFSLQMFDIPFFSVELFYDAPLAFETLYNDSIVIDCADCSTRICSKKHLLKMKREAFRSQDKLDLDNLKAIELIEEHNFSAAIEASKLADLPTTIDDERIQDLISFLKMTPQEKLEWLENMLEALGHFSAF